MKKLFLLLLLTVIHAHPVQAAYQITYQELEKFQLIDFKGDLFAAVVHPQIEQVLSQIHGNKDLVFKVGLSHGGVVSRFTWLIKRLKQECSGKRGSECKLTSVFTARCASACTQFPLHSDEAVSLPAARFGFHRTWFLSPHLTVQSKAGLADTYARAGGNAAWFEANTDKLSRNQVSFYWMTKKEELESQLINHQVKSWSEFVQNY